MSEKSIITIMHTNDLHSHFENWPKIRRYLTAQQETLALGENGVLTVDLGDAMDLIYPLTEVTAGKANVKLLNEIGYDAVTIGNNEGLSLSHQRLEELYEDANFPVTVANLRELADQKMPLWNHNVLYKKMPDGTKIGMIGLTAPFVDAYPLREWTVLEVQPVLERLLPIVKKKADIVILLSHLGLPVDRRLAREFPDVDVIIGAHTHHLLERGELIGNTLLAAAGKWGRYIGKISLTVEDHHIINKVARVVLTADLPDTVTDIDEIQHYLDEGQHELEHQVVAGLPQSFSRTDDSLMQALFAMLKWRTGCNVGMLSTGLLLRDLPAGKITKADLLTLLPHQMYVMRTKIIGKELKRLLLEIHKNAEFVSTFSMVGLGFRGKIFGNLELKGMSIDLHKGEFIYANAPVVDDKIYEFTSLDYYKYLPFFPTIDLVGENEILMENMLREDFAHYLAQMYPIK